MTVAMDQMSPQSVVSVSFSLLLIVHFVLEAFCNGLGQFYSMFLNQFYFFLHYYLGWVYLKTYVADSRPGFLPEFGLKTEPNTHRTPVQFALQSLRRCVNQLH